jgi:hypothetical protein
LVRILVRRTYNLTTTRQTKDTKLLKADSPGKEQSNGHGHENLVWLFSDIFCDRERTQLYRREIRKDDDDEKHFYMEKIRTSWGMPVLDAVDQEDAKGDDRLDNHTFRTLHPSGRNQEPQTFTDYQVKRGQWASAFTGIPIAGQSLENMYANVIFAQQDAFDIQPQRRAEHTGFQQFGNEWVYVLRTSERLHQDGTVTKDHPPISRYTFDTESHAKHIAAWRRHEQELPVASRKGIYDLFKWDIKADTSGNRLLLHLFSYRSLLSSLLPIETAIIAAAKDGTAITDGGSGSGKTSAIDHARGIDGPTPYRAERDVGFKGSITGIETRIGPLRDTLVSISDFHFNTENPSEYEQRTLADKFDSFITALADNGEVRERGTKNITAAQGTRVKAGVVFDGEALPNLFLSRLRRAIVLQFERGTLNVERIKDEWWYSQGLHTAIGRSIIAWILGQLNSNLDGFLFNVQQAEEDLAQYLLADLRKNRPSFDGIIARSLANNYARLLTPIWMIEQVFGELSSKQKNLIKQVVVKSLRAFVDMIDNGGPSTISQEDMITMIKLAFEHGDGYTLAMDNVPLSGKEGDLLNRLGYERTTLADIPWKPAQHGYHLANISKDWGTLWIRPDTLLEIAKRWTKREGIKFPYNQQTFPAFLVRLGIAIKGSRQNTWTQRFGGERNQRLKVPYKLLYSESDETVSADKLLYSESDETVSAVNKLLYSESDETVSAVNDDDIAPTDSTDSPSRSTSGSSSIVGAVGAVSASEDIFQKNDIDINFFEERSELLRIVRDDSQAKELQRAASNRLEEMDNQSSVKTPKAVKRNKSNTQQEGNKP